MKPLVSQAAKAQPLLLLLCKTQRRVVTGDSEELCCLLPAHASTCSLSIVISWRLHAAARIRTEAAFMSRWLIEPDTAAWAGREGTKKLVCINNRKAARAVFTRIFACSDRKSVTQWQWVQKTPKVNVGIFNPLLQRNSYSVEIINGMLS